MTLIDRIETALNSGVDAAVFERCALALLAKHYDKLVPVEGGSDGGRDADIYGPVADDRDSRGRVLVTSGNALSNLKSSHETWKKQAPFRVDLLVMVSLLPLSATRRRNIEQYCRDNDLPLPEFWARDWLIRELAEHSEWRAELTGVKGRLQAIGRQATSEGSTGTGIVGRGEALELLDTALTSGSDVLVVGVPGVGKSRLLRELGDEVHTFHPSAIDYLVDDLVTIAPAVVVVDDAHLHLDGLAALSRARVSEQLSFQILASTWPGHEQAVGEMLNAATGLELERLSLEDLDSIVRGRGISGVRARNLVLEQSDGRPGWAISLCDAVVQGDGQSVLKGQYLLDQVRRYARSIADSATLNDALACIAALGQATIDDLATIADIVKAGPADLVDWLERSANSGLVEHSRGEWSVFTPLRPLLVASWFFGERPTRSWKTLADAFPRDDPRLLTTLFAVADRFPDTAARYLAAEWFDAAVENAPTDEGFLRLARAYSRIDEQSADQASAEARRILTAPRELEDSPWGPHDPVGDMAKKVLGAAFRATCCHEATLGLLDLAISDDRPRNTSIDHPMRTIHELVSYLDPDRGPFVELRHRVFKSTIDWFNTSPSEGRWTVLAEVVRYVFDPKVEGSWSDPGSRLTIRIASSVERPDHLTELLNEWPKVEDLLETSDASLTHEAAAELCTVFELWASMAAGVGQWSDHVTPEHKEAGLRGATTMLGTLAKLASRFPGIPIRANRHIGLVHRWGVAATELPELAVHDVNLMRFVGRRDVEDSVDEWMAQRQREQNELANDIAILGAEHGVREYLRLVAEARVLNNSHEGVSLANLVAMNVRNPDAWLDAAIASKAQVLIGPMIVAARQSNIEISQAVKTAFNDHESRAQVVRAVCGEESELDELSRSIVSNLDDTDAVYLEALYFHESAVPIIRELLVHGNPLVRAMAAISFAEGVEHGPGLPDELRETWKTALLDASPGRLPQHSQWRLREMLASAVEGDAELCADWFIRNADRPSHALHLGKELAGLSSLLRQLPRAQKRRICEELTNDELLDSGFVSDVLGSDPELADELLKAGVVDSATVFDALSGRRDDTIENLAPALLEHGVSAERIAARALGHRFWEGKESDSLKADLEFFDQLAQRKPGIESVCRAAIRRLELDIAHALEEERINSQRGW